MNNETAITTAKNPMEMIQGNVSSWCSVKPETMEEKKALYNALESCDVVLNDIVGKTIKLKDIFIQEYPRTDKETGEPISNGHRVILFDDEGKSYVTASNYFFVNLVKFINAFGEPNTWKEPIPIEITKRPTKNGNQCLSFKLA